MEGSEYLKTSRDYPDKRREDAYIVEMLAVDKTKVEDKEDFSSGEEEEWLMKRVFGQIYVDSTLSESSKLGSQNDITEKELFRIDKKKNSEGLNEPLVKFSEQYEVETLPRPAWTDHHDQVQVSLADKKRLKKLRIEEDDDDALLSGLEFENRLRKQFTKLNPVPNWAQISNLNEPKEEDHALAEEAILRSTKNLSGHKSILLPPDIIDVTRMNNANQQHVSNCAIQTVRFHPKAPVLLSGGLDKSLHFFQIDGKVNSKIQSIHFQDMPIYSAEFSVDGKEVIASGRRKFFYSVNIEQGQVEKISQLQGRNEESLETFVLSPDGEYISFLGKDGYILLVSRKSKQLIANLKMNGTVRALCYSRDKELYSLGGDGEIYIWDLNERKCIRKFRDIGNLRGTSIAWSHHNFATGDDAGVVNIYDPINSFGKEDPVLQKSLMNLKTKISDLKFNHDGQILGVASNVKKNAFRLAHIPTMRVFSNWPTSHTPLHYVSSFDFSSKSEYVALGNDRGQVLLYKLNHFTTA